MMLQTDKNPWLGLASYEYNDAYRFFGREEELSELKTAICNNLFTTIYGISGAGKTSLINAGIMPLLEKEGYLPVRVRLDHKSKIGYNTQIVKAIVSALEKSGGEVETENVIAQDSIAENEILWNFLFTSKFWSKSNHQVTPVIFIDQFEEIFTNNDSEETIRDFFEVINSLQYNNPPINTSSYLTKYEKYVDYNDVAQLRIVLIMREDFLARLEDYSFNIPALRKNRRGIKRMNGIQALEVIQKPMPDIVTRNVAIHMLGKVTGKIIKDTPKDLVRTSVDTSILSLFCSELYQKAVLAQQSTLTNELVGQFGDNIISSFYDDTMGLVSSKTMEYLESHLLTYSGFRNSVALEDLEQNGIKKEELTRLTEKRLIRIETSDGIERVEYTHDVLCGVAKAHRDLRLQKNERKSNLFYYTRYIFETTGVTLILVYFIYYSYLHGFWFVGAIPKQMPAFLLSLLFSYYIFKNGIKQKGHSTLKICFAYILLFLSSWLNYGPWTLSKTYFINNFGAVSLPYLGNIYTPALILFVAIILHTIYKKANSKNIRLITSYLWAISLFMLFESSFRILFVFFISFLFLFVFSPYCFKREKNYWKLCLLGLPCVLVLSIIDINIEPYIWMSVYLLTNLIFSFFYYKKKKSFEETIEYCLSFQIYREYPFLKQYALVILFLLTYSMLYLIGIKLDDTYTIILTPFLCCILVYLVCNLSIGKHQTSTEEVNMENIIIPLFDRKIDLRELKKFLWIFLAVICVLASQYCVWHLCFMVVFWGVSLYLVYRLYSYKTYKQLNHHYNKYKALLISIVIWGSTIFIGSMLGMGYNIFTLSNYSRVYNGNICERPVTKFLTIKDSEGNVGLRDRNSLVIPVKYDSISLLKFDARHLSNAGFLYRLEQEEDFYYFEGRNNLPQIIFKLIKRNNARDIWDCSQHLDMDNICTTMLLSNYHSIIRYNQSEYTYKELLPFYITTLIEKGVSINSINTLFEDSYEDCFGSIARGQTDALIGFKHKLFKYKLLPFTNDTTIQRKIIETITVSTKSDTLSSSYYLNASQWLAYLGDYKGAERCAMMSLNNDTSTVKQKQVYVPLIESMFLLQKYDSAYKYINKYKDEFYFTEARTVTTAYRDTVTGPDPFFKRYSIGDEIYHDIMLFKKLGRISDTTSVNYLRFIAQLDNFKNKPHYSYAKRMGYGDNTYYLCKSFRTNFYQFFMYKGKQVSPCFERYAVSWPYEEPKYDYEEWYEYRKISSDYEGRILLIIDIDDKKRKYINFTSGIPITIPGTFDHAWTFSEGLAVVAIDNKLGIIDTKGNFVVPPKFEFTPKYPKCYSDYINLEISNWGNNLLYSWSGDFHFHNGLCPMVDSNGQYGLINKHGDWIQNAEYSYISEHTDTCWLVKKNGKYGMLDKKGAIVIPVEYNFKDISCKEKGWTINSIPLDKALTKKQDNDKRR